MTIEIINNYCKKTDDVAKHLESDYKGCQDNATAGYTYLTDYTTGAVCKARYRIRRKLNIIKPLRVIRYGDYGNNDKYLTKRYTHVHQYDDKWNVTGVNMLNASDPEFNLINAIPDTSTPVQNPGDEPVPESGGHAVRGRGGIRKCENLRKPGERNRLRHAVERLSHLHRGRLSVRWFSPCRWMPSNPRTGGETGCNCVPA